MFLGCLHDYELFLLFQLDNSRAIFQTLSSVEQENFDKFQNQDRGKRRIVAVKSTNAQGKSTFGPVYVTLDHYRTFCQA